MQQVEFTTGDVAIATVRRGIFFVALNRAALLVAPATYVGKSATVADTAHHQNPTTVAGSIRRAALTRVQYLFHVPLHVW